MEKVESEMDDPFVDYAIAGAMKVFMVNCCIKEDMSSFSTNIVHKLLYKETSSLKIRILSCLNCVLSSKSFKTVCQQNVLLEILVQNFDQIIDSNVQNDVDNFKFEQNDICLFEVIKFYRKVIKCILRNDTANQYELLGKMCRKKDKIWNLMLNINYPLLTKSVLKLFNVLLPYGNLLSSNISKTHLVFKQTADFIFKNFHQHGFCRIHPGRESGFTGVSTVTSTDKVQLRLMILLALKTIALSVSFPDSQGEEVFNGYEKCLIHLDLFVKFHQSELKVDNESWVLKIFEDQDDMWIESLLALLDVYNQIILQRNFRELPVNIQVLLNPHYQFIDFIKTTNYDESILIDLLTSPETCFLLYINRYIKCLGKEWHSFLVTVKEIKSKYEIDNQIQRNMGNWQHAKCHDENGFERENMAASSSGLMLLGLYDSDSDDESVDDSCDQTEKKINLELERNEKDGIISPGDKVDASLYDKNNKLLKNIPCTEQEIIDDGNTQSSVDICSERIKHCSHGNEISDMCKDGVISHGKDNDVTVHAPCDLDLLLDLNQQEKHENDQKTEQNKAVNFLFSNGGGKLACNIEGGVKSREDKYIIDKIISCIIRMKLKILRLCKAGLFPYNPEPLLFNISKVEDLYENQE